MTNHKAQERQQRPRVVVIGAGFGGLSAARALAGAPVDVTIIDRNNYHGFWPLLYQVATAGLESQSIAQPVRAIVQRWPNVSFFLATVNSIDRERRVVCTDRRDLPYDHVIVAAGSETNFFGLDPIEQQGFILKDIPDALALRNHLLTRFEEASTETDPDEVQKLLTFVIVGGGPAGAIEELINHVLHKDYPELDFSRSHVILLEMMDRLLPPFPPSLSEKAKRTLERMGVEVRLNTKVVGFEHGRLELEGGETMPTETVIWTAGVKGSSLGETITDELQRGGRVPVTPELHLADDPRVWVIGDLAYLEGPDGKPYPQVAQVAMQQGETAARNIMRTLRRQPLEPFRYFDKGSLATIGRRAAVARIAGINWSGPLAWYLWLGVHLWQLAGLHNRVQVFITWLYNYLTFDRANRAVVPVSVRVPEQSEGYGAHAAALVEEE